MINDLSKKLPLIIHLFYFLLASTFCFLYYLRVMTNIDLNSVQSINSVLSFTTIKPYQFRLLFPFIFKVATLFGLLSPKLVLLTLNLLIVYFILLVYRLILNEYFIDFKKNIFLAPLILYPMVWNLILLNQSYAYYDFMSILIYTLGFYMIIRENYKGLLIVFTLGMMNKETTAYLIFAFALFNYQVLLNKKILLKTNIMVFIFIVIKTSLYFIFKNNLGSPVEITVYGNLETLAKITQNHIYLKNILLNFGLIYVFIIIFFVTGKWRIYRSLYFKRLMCINLTFIPFLLFGIFIIYFAEVRVYTELIPVITTLFIIYLSTFENLGIVIVEK